MSSLLAPITAITKQKTIPASVIDVLGNYVSVRLSFRGEKLHGLKYIGGRPSIGDAVYVNYQSGFPVVYTNTSQLSISTVVASPSSSAQASQAPPPLEQGTNTTKHNDLSGIQGGTLFGDGGSPEYYHLNFEEYGVYGKSIFYVDLSSQVDGSNTEFEIGSAAYKIIVFYNGLALTPSDYILSATKTSFITAFAPMSGDEITVLYLKNTLPIIQPLIPQADLVLHLDANAISGLVDGNPISSWIDSGPNSLEVTASGIYRPVLKTNIINGNPVVRFDGEDKMSIIGIGSLLSTSAHLFIVASVDDTYYNLYNHSTDIDSWWRYSPSNSGYLGCFRTSRVESYPADMPLSGLHLFELRSSGAGYEFFLDQISKGVNAAGFSAGDSVHTIGCPEVDGASSGKYLFGDIAEIIVYGAIKSGVDLQDTYDYLGIKYNL